MSRIISVFLIAFACVNLSAASLDWKIYDEAAWKDVEAEADSMRDWILRLSAMYKREVQTEAGRVRWHGKLVSQEVNTNALIKIDRYLDGTCFTNEWKLITPKDSVRSSNEKLPKGMPSKLVEAKARRIAAKKMKSEGIVSNVVVTVVVGDSKKGGEKK